MPNQDIVNYIKTCREQRIADDIIKNELLKVGWEKKDVDEGFAASSPVQISEEKPKTKTPLWAIVAFSSAIIIAGVAGAVYYFSGKSNNNPQPATGSPENNSVENEITENKASENATGAEECLSIVLNQSSPEETVRSFANALICDDLEKALLLFNASDREHYGQILGGGTSDNRISLGKTFRDGIQPLREEYKDKAIVQMETLGTDEAGAPASFPIMLVHSSDDKWYIISM